MSVGELALPALELFAGDLCTVVEADAAMVSEWLQAQFGSAAARIFADSSMLSQQFAGWPVDAVCLSASPGGCRAHERARELAVDFGCEPGDVECLARRRFARVLDTRGWVRRRSRRNRRRPVCCDRCGPQQAGDAAPESEADFPRFQLNALSGVRAFESLVSSRSLLLGAISFLQIAR